jgi:hypothetical protein
MTDAVIEAAGERCRASDLPAPASLRPVTMFADLLRRGRERSGFTVEQAARRFGVTPAAYTAIKTGERWPD